MLKSDDDRDNFVRAFWERRNPAPGSSENKFKEEHYRRLAYANVHFASNAPGWQSDRGQVYIMEGPPDEITSSQESNQNVETWHYTSIGGNQPPHDVKFLDRCNCGEFVRER